MFYAHDYDYGSDELDDLRLEAKAERQYRNRLARHHNCQDPDHPGCEACEGDDYDDE